MTKGENNTLLKSQIQALCTRGFTKNGQGQEIYPALYNIAKTKSKILLTRTRNSVIRRLYRIFQNNLRDYVTQLL